MSKQESAQGTIEDKLNNILEDFCSEHNDEWLNITVKQLQDFITTETTKARTELIDDLYFTPGGFENIWEKVCNIKAALQKEQHD